MNSKKLTFFDILKTEDDYLNELNNGNRDVSLGLLKKIWQENRPDYKTFCDDGILIEDDWDNSRTKILFLLKETFKDFSVIKGKHGPKGNSNTFWRKMQMWTNITDKIYSGNEASHKDAKASKENPNKEIAYVNIKKNVTKDKQAYKTNSADDDIKKYAVSDAKLLKKQIDLINPDVIICCGTYKYIKHILPLNIENSHLYGKKWVVDFKHLSNRNPYQKDNEDLISKLENIKNCR